MTNLLLFVLLLSKDTIITNLVPKSSPAPPLTLRIVNTSITPLRNITLEWSLQTNGAITAKGKAPIPILAPNKPALLRLPLRLPDDTAGETFLQLHYRSAPAAPTAAPPLLAQQQLLIKPYRPRLTVVPAGEITFSDENDIFTIRSPTIRISFNRQTGWLVHYEIKGIDLLDDTLGLRSNFWWPGYNDSAPPDSGWLAATREPHLQVFSNTTSPELIIIRTEYTLPATASLLHLSYTINAGGEMLITQQVEPDTTQPPSRPWRMPCFGMQWILPPGYDSITAYGPLPPNVSPNSGTVSNPNNSPNSATPPRSALPAIFHDHPVKPLPSDSNARDAATRMDIRWWTIADKDGNGLRFIADTPFLNESALHCFDSDLMTIHPSAADLSAEASAKTTLRRQIQLSIDRPASSILLPIGNYQYTYKVKPLVSSTPVNTTHPIAN
jgi:beta-galactosidase